MSQLSRITFGLLICAAIVEAFADETPVVRGVDRQPLEAQVKRVVQALTMLGTPLEAESKAALDKALENKDAAEAVVEIQKTLDSLCLAVVTINPESRVKVAAGPAPPKLIQQGWRVFLVKVNNEGGVTAPLAITSPNSAPVYKRSSNSPSPPVSIKPNEVGDRWLDVSSYDRQPLNKALSGLAVEYRIAELYSRDAGRREAKLAFDVGQGTQDLGFRNELNVLFDCEPACKVRLEVLDEDGKPTTGQFIIHDVKGRVYPSLARRMAPDFFFHEQIYRGDGETVLLPPGKYKVDFGRGPESRVEHRTIEVPAAATHKESFRVRRWIKMADYGWYSGDHHVHAAGCAHYESPTEGVTPADMMRHIIGEDLNVGCVLSWGPCWYHQKQFFEGKTNNSSTSRNLMRYDVEVSGFPSSHAGHLCLLRLKEDDYPDTTKIDEWPSWDLPILKWAKAQGGVTGFAHSGSGLYVKTSDLPNYVIPPFDGIGANEFIVDVTHGACDFISTIDTNPVSELNIWYHTLNCGYTARISGETDFPCIFGERVGIGRAYVKLDKGQPLDYDRWCDGLRDGRSYCCDGYSHLFDFSVGGLGVGEKGRGGKASVLAAVEGKPLEIRARAAALLAQKPRDDIRKLPFDKNPCWHIERARIGDTNRVPVELIVNGKVAERKEITADGSVQDLTFELAPQHSAWIALRIYPSCHTNPVFVELDGKPIRASKKSAQWCLDSVDACWKKKSPAIRPAERAEAEAAYESAREAYRKILAELTAE